MVIYCVGDRPVVAPAEEEFEEFGEEWDAAMIDVSDD